MRLCYLLLHLYDEGSIKFGVFMRYCYFSTTWPSHCLMLLTTHLEFTCPLSIIHYQLSIIHYELSIIHHELSIIHHELSIDCRLMLCKNVFHKKDC